MKKYSTRILKNLKGSNNLLLLEDFAQRRCALRGFPVSVHLATDPTCNLRCPMCWQRSAKLAGSGLHPIIEEKHFITFARQVFPTAFSLELNISGEPLMSHLVDLEIALAEEYGVKILLTTNGLLLDAHKKRLATLMRNVQGITFSFDSPDKKTYSALRVGSDFDHVVANMRLFQRRRKRLSLKQRPGFSISMVLMQRNFRQLSEMVHFTKQIGADRLIVHAMTVFTKPMEKQAIDYNASSIMRESKKAQALALRLGLSLVYPAALRNANVSVEKGNDRRQSVSRVVDMPCKFLWFRVYLNALAQIVTCCSPSHPIMGSLKEHSFEKIWNNSAYQAMRKGFIDKNLTSVCKACVREGVYYYLL